MTIRLWIEPQNKATDTARLLRYLNEGRSIREAADLAGIPKSTAHRWVQEAYAKGSLEEF